MELCVQLFLLFLYIPTLICKNNEAPINVLLVLVDDMGSADASFNHRLNNPKTNQAPILTPHIDYLANNGIILANHYTNMICGPTRSALITSRFAYKIGNPFSIQGQGHIHPKYHTFAHELQSRGYRNHFIGKYGIDEQDRHWDHRLGQWMPPVSSMSNTLGPLSRGFDTFYGLYNSGHNHFTKKVIGIALDWHKFNETHLLEAPHTLDPEVDVSSTHLFTRETIQAIQHDTDNKRPWFIHLSYTMPHDPMMVDDKYITDFQHCAKIKSWRRRVYCGMVTSVDEGIGNITRHLQDNNLLENTVIIFSSDNGGFPNVGGFNYPDRGMKISPYEGGVKTLAFVYNKRIFPNTSGLIFKNNIHVVDYGPTLLGVVDAAMGKAMKHDMGDIDGWDYSETLKHFNDHTNRDLLNRNEFVVEARWWNNMTVYRYNQYKLFIGSFLYDQLFIEPDDAYSLNSHDRMNGKNMDWVVTDWINYLIHRILGVDWFWFEWNVSMIGRMISTTILKGRNCPRPPIPFRMDRPGNNETLFWPYIDSWDEECQRVRLYDLEKDPTESHNLAYKEEYRKVVDEMMKRVQDKLQREYELNQIEKDLSAVGLLPLVKETSMKLMRTMMIVICVIIMLACICCWKCYGNIKYRRSKGNYKLD
eukprot:175345_1